ncbi:glycosyltransferase family A protein [Phenylobacterium sp. LjRoot225]|uniref:glycosyltransferase family 2 protein n=1 Tax=Phenylobacterium sp. LjRoot225 TaxID=3342285 RepID=UPI003ECF70E0
MPFVTVAIPAYKAEHLGQAIASVLAQTFTDFELLISDDCPDDAVRAVVAQFSDPRIRLISGPRDGLVANSVRLWDSATADLLKYVYDDDFLLPFGLAELVDAIGHGPEFGYAFCWRYVVDGAGKVLFRQPSFDGDKKVVFTPSAVLGTIIGEIRNPIGEPTNVLIRRSRFADSRCLSSYAGRSIRHHIDLAFYLNACERGPCIGVPTFGAAFRRHANQVTSLERSPDFAYGVAEWEIFVRAAVTQGLVAPEIALRNLDRLAQHYDNHRAAFPEIDALAAALPALRAALERGERDLLGGAFHAQLERIDAGRQRPEGQRSDLTFRPA